MPYFTNCVAQPDLYRVERHNKEGTVCLCAREDRLLVVVSGEPPGPTREDGRSIPARARADAGTHGGLTMVDTATPGVDGSAGKAESLHDLSVVPL